MTSLFKNDWLQRDAPERSDSDKWFEYTDRGAVDFTARVVFRVTADGVFVVESCEVWPSGRP